MGDSKTAVAFCSAQLGGDARGQRNGSEFQQSWHGPVGRGGLCSRMREKTMSGRGWEGLRNDLWEGFSCPTTQRRSAASWGVASHMLSCLHFVLPQKQDGLLPRLGPFPGHSCLTQLGVTGTRLLRCCSTSSLFRCCEGLPVLRAVWPLRPSPASLARDSDGLQRSTWRQLFLAQNTKDHCPRLPQAQPRGR